MIDIEAILDDQEPRIRRAFLTMIANMRGSIDLQDLEDLLEAGRIDQALQLVLQLAPNIGTASSAAFIAAGQAVASAIGKEIGEVTIDFNVVNTRAVTAMQNNQLDLVSAFTRQQTEATQQAIVRGIRSGANPRDQARAFRDSIGLTPTQEAAVANYRRALETGDPIALSRKLRNSRNDAAVRRALESNTPLTDAQIERFVTQYRSRSIAMRAETIARTEALRSVHEGNDEMFAQAIEDGTLDADQIERTWNTAKDERVRGSHRTMHGQVRRVGEPFVSGAGNLLMRPGDSRAPASEVIKCRCRVGTTLTVSQS